MRVDYADGSFLAFWYDSWLAVIGTGIALVLTVLVLANGDWKPSGLTIKTVLVLAVIAGIPLVMVRLGIRLAVDTHDPIGYISFVGTIVALAVGLPVVYKQFLAQRQASAVEFGEAGAPEFGMTGDFSPGEAGLATGAFGSETPVPGSGTATIAGGLGQTQSYSPTGWLHFKSGPNAGQSMPLSAETMSMGRGEENDIVIDDATVSRRHAAITFQEGQYFVEDAGSMGGTLVEGLQATRTLLTSGASLQLGQTEVVFMEAEVSSMTAAGSGTVAGRQAPGETVVLPATQAVMAWLAVTSGPQKGKTYQLKAGDNTIGRSPDNDFAIEDTSMSRSHSMVKVQDDSILMVDLGSRGGTRVGENTLEGKVLRTGGTIGVGQTQLSLVEVEAAPEPEPGTMSGQTIVDQAGGGAGGVLTVRSGPDA